MQRLFTRRLGAYLIILATFLAGCMVGQQASQSEKTLMHIFAYTPQPGATQQDYANFEKATADMVGKIPGLRRVWVGKLREPTPAENDTVRTYGVAMEFDDLNALGAYAQHPAHREWQSIYDRVKTQGSTSFDIVR